MYYSACVALIAYHNIIVISSEIFNEISPSIMGWCRLIYENESKVIDCQGNFEDMAIFVVGDSELWDGGSLSKTDKVKTNHA